MYVMGFLSYVSVFHTCRVRLRACTDKSRVFRHLFPKMVVHVHDMPDTGRVFLGDKKQETARARAKPRACACGAHTTGKNTLLQGFSLCNRQKHAFVARLAHTYHVNDRSKVGRGKKEEVGVRREDGRGSLGRGRREEGRGGRKK